MADSVLFSTAQTLAKQFRQNAAKADQQGALPEEDISAIQSSGILQLAVPKIYGGLGGSLYDVVNAQLELAKGSGSTGLVIAMTLHIVGHEREIQSWADWARERIFADVAAGALINSAASEPRLGSPSRGGLPDTYATYQHDQLIVNGHKNWVTGGTHLKHLLVRLRLEEEAVVVWLPAGTPGIRWEKTWGDGLSLRASDSHDVFFENAGVPETHLIQQGSSPGSPWFPMLMAANYFGVALEARDAVIRYALERTPTALGKPIATLPKIQRQIGEIDIALQAAKLFLLDTARAWHGTKHDSYMPLVAAAKHFAVETALDVTDKTLRIAGAAGVDKGLSLERCFRDVRAGLMHPPSGDTALEIVGRSALGM